MTFEEMLEKRSQLIKDLARGIRELTEELKKANEKLAKRLAEK